MSEVYYVTQLCFFLQEAKLSQETLADQVVKTNEEKYKLTEKLEAANKVKEGFSVYRLPFSRVWNLIQDFPITIDAGC